MGARYTISRRTQLAGTSSFVPTPDALSGWYGFPHCGPPTVASTGFVRLVDSIGDPYCVNNFQVDTPPNGPFHNPWNQGYWFVHPEMRFQLSDALSDREWSIVWVRGPHRDEKGKRSAGFVYAKQTLPDPGGPGGAWNDVGQLGGFAPVGRPWLQLMSDALLGQGVDCRLVDATGATVYSYQALGGGFILAGKGVMFHPPGVRLQARGSDAYVRRILATWSPEGGSKAP